MPFSQSSERLRCHVSLDGWEDAAAVGVVHRMVSLLSGLGVVCSKLRLIGCYFSSC